MGASEQAAALIERLWGDRVEDRAKSPGVKDYKTRLQEVLAKDGRRPEYGTEGTGPDHERMFTAWVACPAPRSAGGAGRSKKEAEQEAAREALDVLSSGVSLIAPFLASPEVEVPHGGHHRDRGHHEALKDQARDEHQGKAGRDVADRDQGQGDELEQPAGDRSHQPDQQQIAEGRPPPSPDQSDAPR